MNTRRALPILAAVALSAMAPKCEPPAPPPLPPEPPSEQGLGPNEEDAAARLVPALLAQDRLAMVATARRSGSDFVYAVYADLDRDGRITRVLFRRSRRPDGTYDYPRVGMDGDLDSGQDPLARTDPRALASYEEELGASGGTGLIPLAATTFPYAEERIAAAFDHPGAGDLLLVHTPAGTDPREIGNHGNLDVTQSRSPLVLSGAGVRPADGTATGTYTTLAKLVDIAPTVAKALGVAPVRGLRLDGSPGTTYLKRQDGRVLDEVLDGRTARRAVIVVSDGASHTRLRRLLEQGRLPFLARLVRRGGFFREGAIGNLPSNTYPGHNVIGTGCYSGHHGLLDNDWYDRKDRAVKNPYEEKIGSSDYLSPGVETLFEALERTHGRWDGRLGGAYTISIGDPCSRGASLGLLELDFPQGFPLIDGNSVVPVPDSFASSRTLTLGMALQQVLTMAVERQFLEGGTKHPFPMLTLLNLPLTDMYGHEAGPHSPLADDVYIAMDAFVGLIVRRLEKLGLLEDTLFVVTADHGMALQDRAAAGTLADALVRAGVEGVFSSERFVYLKCVDVEVSLPALQAGTANEVVVTVRDDDFDSSRVRPGISEAEVAIEIGSRRWTARTDYVGQAVLSVTPPAGSSRARIVVEAPGFTRAVREMPVR
ncbi:MAG: alkaline phosphatase family protein [Planctomycetes bacterium]|nr:alkaline phosphatase family protein [Planctomycetota bacterium]